MSSTVSARPTRLAELADVLDRHASEVGDLGGATLRLGFAGAIGRAHSALGSLERDLFRVGSGVALVGTAFDEADRASFGVDASIAAATTAAHRAADAAVLGFDRASADALRAALMHADAATLGLHSQADLDAFRQRVGFRLADAASLGLDDHAVWLGAVERAAAAGFDLGLLPASTTSLDLMQGQIFTVQGTAFEIGYGDDQVHPLVYLQVIAPALLIGQIRSGLIDRNYRANHTERTAIQLAVSEWVDRFNDDNVDTSEYGAQLDPEVIASTYTLNREYPGNIDLDLRALVMADGGPAVFAALEAFGLASTGLSLHNSLRAIGRASFTQTGGSVLSTTGRQEMRRQAVAAAKREFEEISEILDDAAIDQILELLEDDLREEFGDEAVDLITLVRDPVGTIGAAE